MNANLRDFHLSLSLIHIKPESMDRDSASNKKTFSFISSIHTSFFADLHASAHLTLQNFSGVVFVGVFNKVGLKIQSARVRSGNLMYKDISEAKSDPSLGPAPHYVTKRCYQPVFYSNTKERHV